MEVSLPEFYEKLFSRPEESYLLNPVVEPSPTLALPNVTATILVYDAIVASGHDVFTVFMDQVLNLHGWSAGSVQARNQRLPIELTEFIRALSPLAGVDRETGKVSLGQAVEQFLSDDLKAEIIETIRTKADDARRVIDVGRRGSGLLAVERQVVRELGHSLYPPPQSDQLFSKSSASWVHYDAEALRQNPHVSALMERALRRTGRDSLWMQGANAGYSAMMALRRLRKRMST